MKSTNNEKDSIRKACTNKNIKNYKTTFKMKCRMIVIQPLESCVQIEVQDNKILLKGLEKTEFPDIFHHYKINKSTGAI